VSTSKLGFEPALTPESKEGVNEVKINRTAIELQAEADSTDAVKIDNILLEPIDFYKLFISELQHLAEDPITIDELIESTQLHKSQLTGWLKRAIDDKVIKKLNRPVRYQVKNS
jgi:predicted Rossmann fold nucleotide-binding protein DprA/Smf involved in DNA uptake